MNVVDESKMEKKQKEKGKEKNKSNHIVSNSDQ